MTPNMEAVRDALIAISDEHEQTCPGNGMACLRNRTAMIGYLAHCMGIRGPNQWRDVREVAESYDRDCKSKDCRHLEN